MGCGQSRQTISVFDEEGNKLKGNKADQVANKIKLRLKSAKTKKLRTEMLASITIQKFFRQYRARIKLREKVCWHIFQKLEYHEETEKIKLVSLMDNLLQKCQQLQLVSNETQVTAQSSGLREDTLHRVFHRPRDPVNLTKESLSKLIEECKRNGVIEFGFTMSILDRAYQSLSGLPNVRKASTLFTHRLHIVGDLHGQLEDLLIIFEKKGLPSDSNPYIFNGDFVDRGPNSVEVAMLILCFFLLYPHAVFINRGNHEDFVMNKTYGFEKEVVKKYGDQAGSLLMAFSTVFSVLPLATIVDGKVFVVHGGISQNFSLELLENTPRFQCVSVMKAIERSRINPDNISPDTANIIDALWSDPRQVQDDEANPRGAGRYWGIRVTNHFLLKHQFVLVIRSHECQENGFQYHHNNQVLTVFSASNYYTKRTNKGAVVTLDQTLHPHITQFISSANYFSKADLTLREEVGVIEAAAVEELFKEVTKHKEELHRGFRSHDPNNTGLITIDQWVQVLGDTMNQLGWIPWRSFRYRFVQMEGNKVIYRSCLTQNFTVNCSLKNIPETKISELYCNLGSLETLFRLMDKDGSGSLSKDEFVEGCMLLNKVTPGSVSDTEAIRFAELMDLDNDGKIGFNEFIEAFRLVKSNENFP